MPDGSMLTVSNKQARGGGWERPDLHYSYTVDHGLQQKARTVNIQQLKQLLIMVCVLLHNIWLPARAQPAKWNWVVVAWVRGGAQASSSTGGWDLTEILGAPQDIV